MRGQLLGLGSQKIQKVHAGHRLMGGFSFALPQDKEQLFLRMHKLSWSSLGYSSSLIIELGRGLEVV